MKFKEGDMVIIDPPKEDRKNWEGLYGVGIWKVVLRIVGKSFSNGFYNFDVVYDPHGALEGIRDNQPVKESSISFYDIEEIREELESMRGELGV